MMYTPVHIAWHYGGSSGTVLPLGRMQSLSIRDATE